MGVLQAINKNQGFFTKDDEGIIKVIAAMAQPVLFNSQGMGEKILQENSQRALLKLFSKLIRCKSEEQLLKVAQKRICSLFDLQLCRIFLIKDENLLYYNQDGQKVELPKKSGMVGQVVETQRLLSVASGYSDFRYNAQVDIDTNLPVITFPVFYPGGQFIIGVIQIINPKGIENLIFDDGVMSISHVLKSILDVIAEFLGQLLSNVKNMVVDDHQINSDDDFL